MLEKPEIKDDVIIHCLCSEYGLQVTEISFLPLGADLNTAVYRAVAEETGHYFVKLRREEFAEASVTVPNYLSGVGIQQIIPALSTQAGQLWAELDPYRMILYPYVEGRHGLERKLAPEKWIEFGAALKQFHTASIPAALTQGVQHENFSPRWREMVKVFLARVEAEIFHKSITRELAKFLKAEQEIIRQLIKRAELCAQILQEQPHEFIVCHGDIHGWNLFIDTNEGLYLVDWDTLIFAPRERDLMFIGAGLGESGYSPQEESRLFYQGYGHTKTNPDAIEYYRCERIIEDIAVNCEQIFTSAEGSEDQKQALVYLRSNFLPGGTIERGLDRA